MLSPVNFRNVLLAISVVLFSCSKEAKQADEIAAKSFTTESKRINPQQGFIYTMSNEASGNSILSFFQQSNGTLALQATTASGGNGNGGGLGSQGSLITDQHKNYLFAVNAGSNTISSFKINEDGSLALVHTISSGGTFPLSLTAHGDILYVVNSTTSNIAGFTIGTGGTLTSIPGSSHPLSTADAGPAEIAFTPDGQRLIVTEKNTNKITSFEVNSAGLAGNGTSINSAGQTPFGFAFAGNTIVVTEASGGAPNGSTVSAYGTFGSTSLTGGPLATNQTAACWAAATRDGRFAYVTNTGSNTISSFEVNSNGGLRLINASEAATGTTPIDIVFSNNELYIYNLNAGSHSISAYKKGGNETLEKLADVVSLPAHAVGLASF
jgi:6-phosphogluconolactonase (cycloisomerase 2 family)